MDVQPCTFGGKIFALIAMARNSGVPKSLEHRFSPLFILGPSCAGFGVLFFYIYVASSSCPDFCIMYFRIWIVRLAQKSWELQNPQYHIHTPSHNANPILRPGQSNTKLLPLTAAHPSTTPPSCEDSALLAKSTHLPSSV